MFIALTILAVLLIINIVLLKFSSNTAQRPKITESSTTGKIVQLKPNFKENSSDVETEIPAKRKSL